MILAAAVFVLCGICNSVCPIRCRLNLEMMLEPWQHLQKVFVDWYGALERSTTIAIDCSVQRPGGLDGTAREGSTYCRSRDQRQVDANTGQRLSGQPRLSRVLNSPESKRPHMISNVE